MRLKRLWLSVSIVYSLYLTLAFAQYDNVRNEAFAVQNFLVKKGYLQPQQVDGIYGPNTLNAAEKLVIDMGLASATELAKGKAKVVTFTEYAMYLDSGKTTNLEFFNDFVVRFTSKKKIKPDKLYLYNIPGTSHAMVRERPIERVVNNMFYVDASEEIKVINDYKDNLGSRWVKIYIPSKNRFGYVVPDQIKGYRP